jgi:DNA polymerase-3 subunit epsilon
VQFSAIDVETANPCMGSICQIGIARFEGGQLVEEWVTLVDPEDYFDDVNVSIHGIGPSMVRGKPKLPDVADNLRRLLESTVSVCHTHYDRIALTRAFAKYGLQPISTSWLDSARVVRRTWTDLAYKGYGLANVCNRIGYEFKHHDALEDAKAAGYVLLAAMRESQQDLEAWSKRINQPLFPELSSQGYEKSSKHRKVEELVAAGIPIRIITESDFKVLCAGT